MSAGMRQCMSVQWCVQPMSSFMPADDVMQCAMCDDAGGEWGGEGGLGSQPNVPGTPQA